MDNHTTDFSHLFGGLEVQKNKTVEYEVAEIVGSPVLVMVHAGEGNKPYFNAISARASKQARRYRSGRRLGEAFEENREHDRELFPKFVIKGWRGIVDHDGNEVPFSVAACASFIEKMPGWLFDRIRNFAADPESFIEDDEQMVSEEEATTLGES